MIKQDWKLLKEIRKVKKLSEEEQQEYWTNKFDKLDSSDDLKIRNSFKTLKEGNYITVFWADNIPYHLNLTNKGVSYNHFISRIKSHNYIMKWIFGIIATVIGAVIGAVIISKLGF